jgi:hypothetical protein
MNKFSLEDIHIAIQLKQISFGTNEFPMFPYNLYIVTHHSQTKQKMVFQNEHVIFICIEHRMSIHQHN